ALCPADAAGRSIATALGTSGVAPRRSLDPGTPGQGGRLQQRTLATSLPPAAWTQPDAPGHLSANAPRGGVVGRVAADNRGHRCRSRLSQSIRVLERVHQMDRLAALGIP